jgi:hypothetical protein
VPLPTPLYQLGSQLDAFLVAMGQQGKYFLIIGPDNGTMCFSHSPLVQGVFRGHRIAFRGVE